MIELKGDRLEFSFPEVHPAARLTVGFQRTLRIPDDGREYPLPAGLGWFPLRHVDDFASTLPAGWLARGGVIAPMHQAEALWISFGSLGWGKYPWAVKVAAGKINAISGEQWSTDLRGPAGAADAADARSAEGRRLRTRRPGAAVKQDYVVVPEQPWLDGFNVAEGRIRQFVAMPLGGGHTAEEQITGRAEVGGLQLLAYPLKAERYIEPPRWSGVAFETVACAPPPGGMGLGLGGLMRQDIEADPHGADAWDLEHPARCFIHLANAEQWGAITGEPMPTRPIRRAEYARAGIPWFDYSAPGPKAAGSDALDGLRTVGEVEADAGRVLPDDGPIPIDRIRRIPDRRMPPVVREDADLA
ncbi:MAG: hypothetical protein WCF04_09075 [Candidatus Nanopelagicales bacterium]